MKNISKFLYKKIVSTITVLAMVATLLPVSIINAADPEPVIPEPAAELVSTTTEPILLPSEPEVPIDSASTTDPKQLLVASSTEPVSTTTEPVRSDEEISQSEEEPVNIVNTCLLPNTHEDTTPLNIVDSGEKSIAAMMAEHGYTIDAIADETNIQVWDVSDPSTATINFNLRVLGKRADHTQILGYYKAGDGSTYTAPLTQVTNTDGEISIPVTIPAAFASSFGFAIQSGDKIWYSETALNSDGKDHVGVYNPSANTYLLAFEDFDNLGDSDYNDIAIEVSEINCVKQKDEEPADPSDVVNTCVLPSSLDDTAPFVLMDSGEKTIAEVMADYGYTLNPVTDQKNFQVWNIASGDTTNVTFDLKVLSKRAGNTQILGYYKAGDSLTFTSVLTQVSDTDGEISIPVTIPAAFASSFGFAIQSGDKIWYSETALNSDGKDHVGVYNPSANTYLLAFEDFDNLGDGDYNDLAIEITGVVCSNDSNDSNGGGGGAGANRSGGSSRSTSLNRPTPAVLGESTSMSSTSAPTAMPMVLGEQVSAVPYGAPAAGGGGTSSQGGLTFSLAQLLVTPRRTQIL